VVSLLDCGLGDAELAAEFLGLEAMVGMMLTGLIRRLAG
jgi:hypothetical protein